MTHGWMKLCLREDEGMLCAAAYWHLGEPEAVVLEYDVLRGETNLRAASEGEPGADVLEPTNRFGYHSIFSIDEPPIEPSSYRLHPNRDGSLTVDLTPCPT